MKALLVGAALLVVVIGLGLLLGPSGVLNPFASGDEAARSLFMLSLRLPQVLLAVLCGAALAVSGAALQGMLHNPLAEPYILGISGGGAVGAMVHALLPLGGLWGRASFAFLGALVSALLVFRLAGGLRRGVRPGVLLLAGVMLNVLCSSLIVLFLTLTDRIQSHHLFFWLMGLLGQWRIEDLLPFVPLLLGLIGGLCLLGHPLNLLAQGSDRARLLGIDPDRLQALLLVLTACTVGVVVALGGIIGFVGLVAPHALRLRVTADYRLLLPLCALWGGVFLTLSDLVARSVYAPVQLPVGSVTALVGAPFFLWLLVRNRHGISAL